MRGSPQGDSISLWGTTEDPEQKSLCRVMHPALGTGETASVPTEDPAPVDLHKAGSAGSVGTSAPPWVQLELFVFDHAWAGWTEDYADDLPCDERNFIPWCWMEIG